MSLKATSVPTKRLNASITSTQLNFKLDDIIGWNGVALTAADFGTQGYGVFRNSNRTQIELFEFDPATIASASITIVRRGLKFDGDRTTEVSGNKFEWTAGDTFVDLGTDTPQLWQWLKTYVDEATYAGLTQTAFDAFLSASTASSKILITAIETTTGVTHSLTTVAGQRVLVFAKGNITHALNGEAPRNMYLNYNGVQKDTVRGASDSDGTSAATPFFMMYTETPGAATQNITVTSDAALENVVITVIKF